MTRNQIIDIIEAGLGQLYIRDHHLLRVKSKEESINHHLANYIQRFIVLNDQNDLHVDLEYDKHGDRIKKIRIRRRVFRIRPDAIFHQRGHDRRNFLAVECKKGYTTSHDRNKIIALLQHPYNYRYGALISYLPDHDHFRLLLYYRWGGTIDYISKDIAKEA